MKNILVPTDLTENTYNAVKYSINLGVKSNSKLFFYISGSANEHDTKEKGLKFVRDIFTELHLNFETAGVEFIIESIPFSDSLIEIAIDKYDSHLVVLGSDHESSKTTFYGGHISELINEVSCPVLSIPQAYTNIDIKRIAYATELHDLTKRIKKVVPFARLFDASIELFHVYPVYPLVVDVEKYNVKKKLDKLKEKNDYEKIELHFIKTPFSNEPVKGIREFVRTFNPDLLVMFHKPRGLFDKLAFDSGATPAVAKTTPVPLLAINKKTAFKIM
jgi:nucleotide-binding universal stress UspA family protein